MGSLDEKNAEEATRPRSPVALGTTAEVHDLTVLGYKPELQRNRSMFTLLFQSLAIAAVRVFVFCVYRLPCS